MYYLGDASEYHQQTNKMLNVLLAFIQAIIQISINTQSLHLSSYEISYRTLCNFKLDR